MIPPYEVPWYTSLLCAVFLGYGAAMYVNLYEFLYWLLTEVEILPNWDPINGSLFGLGR